MPSAFELNASVNLDATSVNASAKQIQQALGRITGQASEFQKSLDASTARVFAFGATTAVLNGVTQSFKKLVAVTIEVEKRLVEVNSIFQATEATFNRFRNSIFQVAKETGQSFNTVADGAAELARQGLSAEETAKRLKAALVLTRISGLDAEKSVKALTAAINGFTSAGLSANQIVNKMVAVDTAFAVSTQDLAEAFSRAGSTAEDAGVSFDQLLGLVTAVEQKTARGGAVIGNAFKSIFTRLQRGNTIDQLKQLGVEIDATQTGIQKLSALSAALERISDPTTASAIKELAGGVFQINVVSAALKDLGADTSVFASAAKTAAQATNEAFTKNAELNKTISAQINTLVVGLTSMAEKMGKLTFGPLLQNLVGIATKLTDFLDNALDPEKGNVFIKGLFKTIGTFLGGPAVVIFTAAFVKIFGLVAKFAKDGLKSVFQIGSQTQKISAIESGLVGLLQRDSDLRKIIQSTTASQATKEQAVIQAIQTENALLTQQAALMKGLATAAAARGVTGFGMGGFTGKGGKKKFNAGFRAEEAEARMRGAPSNVRGRYSAGTIGGSKFIMNSHETEIPRFGRNGDSAVIPHYAGGFVPNYGTAGIPLGGFAGPEVKKAKANALVKQGIVSPKTLEMSMLPKQKKSKVEVNPIQVPAGNYAYLVPSQGDKTAADPDILKKGWKATAKSGGNNYPFVLSSGFEIFAPDTKKKDVDEDAKPWNTDLNKRLNSVAAVAGARYGKQLVIPDSARRKVTKGRVSKRLKQGGNRGAYGAMQGAVGAVFEAATMEALGISETSTKKKRGDFDVRGIQSKENLKKLFDIGGQDIGDMKVSGSESNAKSFVGKILTEQSGLTSNYNSRLKKAKAAAGQAAGYIPNFNRQRGYGVRDSQIRIHRDSIGEPLAVTNTRDEPRGLRDAIDRERQGIGMAARGFIPNFISEEEALRLDMRQKGRSAPKGNRRIKRSDPRYQGASVDEVLAGDDGSGGAAAAARGVVMKFGEETKKATATVKQFTSGVKGNIPPAKKAAEETEDLADKTKELAEESSQGGGKMAGLSTALIGASMAISMWSESVREANAETQAAADAEIEKIKASKEGFFTQQHLIKVTQDRADAEIEARSGILKFSDAVSKGVTVLMSLAALKMLIPAGIAAKGAGAITAAMAGATAAGATGTGRKWMGKKTGGGKFGKLMTGKAARGIGRLGGGLVAAGTGAFQWMNLNKQFQNQEISRADRDIGRGGIGGGVAGGLAGAALGTAVLPIIGTAIGGAIGYWAGTAGGKKVAEWMGFGESDSEKQMRKGAEFATTFKDEALIKAFGKGTKVTLGDILKDESLSDAFKQDTADRALLKQSNQLDGTNFKFDPKFDKDVVDIEGFVPKALREMEIEGGAAKIGAIFKKLDKQVVAFTKGLDPKSATAVQEELVTAQKAYQENIDSINKLTAEELKKIPREKRIREVTMKLIAAYEKARGAVDLNDEEFERFTAAIAKAREEITKIKAETQVHKDAFGVGAKAAIDDTRTRGKITPTGPFAEVLGFQNTIDTARAKVLHKLEEQIDARDARDKITESVTGGQLTGVPLETVMKANASEIKAANEVLKKANTALALQMEDSVAELVNTESKLIAAIEANTLTIASKQLGAVGSLAADAKAMRNADFGKAHTAADNIAKAQKALVDFDSRRKSGDLMRATGKSDKRLGQDRLTLLDAIDNAVGDAGRVAGAESGGSKVVRQAIDTAIVERLKVVMKSETAMSEIGNSLASGSTGSAKGQTPESIAAKKTAIENQLKSQVIEIFNTTKAFKGLKEELIKTKALLAASPIPEQLKKDNPNLVFPENYMSMTPEERESFSLPALPEGSKTSLVDIANAMGGDVKKAAEGILSARANLAAVNEGLANGAISMNEMVANLSKANDMAASLAVTVAEAIARQDAKIDAIGTPTPEDFKDPTAANPVAPVEPKGGNPLGIKDELWANHFMNPNRGK